MGVSVRLLLLVAVCLVPAMAAEVLIARGILPAAIAVPASIATALPLGILVARLLLLRPIDILLRELEQALPGGACNTPPATEFETLAQGLRALAGELTRQEALHRQRAELLQATLAERTRALSDCNNRLQVALADIVPGERHRLTGQLASGVAHDFNNMLATVLGCLELMERRVGDPERLLVLIERATDAVDRATKLTSGLVHFARRQNQPRRPTDLNALVADLTPLLASAVGRRVGMTVKLTPVLGLVHADPAGVELALVAICLATRAAIPNGGQIVLATHPEPPLPMTATPDPPPYGPYRTISILAEGENLGQPDLMEARRTAEQAGAVVHFGKGGTTIEVALLLPCAKHDADSRQIVPLPMEPRHRALGLRVLLVDDDDAVRQVTSSMLQDLGCTVIEAPNGGAAVTLLEGAARGADLLILDYAMPGMNGLELARAARARGVTAPVLLATGYADLAERSETARTVLDAVLRKPFTAHQLHDAITGLCNQSGQGPNVVPLRAHSG
jgi:CheY-like chemotaxis protein/signal transduction histidine kinase